MTALQLPFCLDALTDGIGIVGAAGIVCAANTSLAMILDYDSRDQLLVDAEGASIFTSQDDIRAIDQLLTGAGSIERRVCSLRTRTGEERAVTVTADLRPDGMLDAVFVPARGGDDAELAHVRDLLRRTQFHMAQTERMKAVGLLSGFLAHELNNVFGSVIGRAQLMQMKTTDERLLRECAYIVQAAEQGVAEVKRLLQFIHKSRQQYFGPMSIEEVFDEACAVLEPEFDKCRQQRIPVCITKHFEEHTKILGYVSEVREIITHLLRNACDAMPDGGTITAVCEYGADEITLTIADTGAGISNEMQRRLFEPMFTTKGEQHAGMGLTIIKELLRKMKGSITFTTDMGKGTSFVVTFPKNEAVPVEAGRQAQNRQIDMDPRFVSKILIVDDDEGVLVSLDKLLASKGFVTKATLDSRDAVRLAPAFQPDILITDLAMPEMNGWELAKQIRTICPGTKIILMTAFVDMLTDIQMKQTAVDVVMQKPLNMPQLLNAIITG